MADDVLHHLQSVVQKKIISSMKPPTKLLINKLNKYLLASLKVDLLVEIQLLLLSFCIGIQDAISLPDFLCFASNQTGNSVVFAIGLARIGGALVDIPNVAISLASFIGGAILTGQLAHFAGTKRRSWLILSHVIQTLMTFAAAALQGAYIYQGPTSVQSRISIFLLAFASGAQVASMRPMQISEITTAMATAAWIDLVIDPNLLAKQNRPRNRRAGFLAALIAGSFAGAFMHSSIGASNALVVSGIGKAIVTVSLLFNKEQEEVVVGCEMEEVA